MPDEPFDGWMREMEGRIESTRQSERLTAEDFAVTINATSDTFGAVGGLRRVFLRAVNEMERADEMYETGGPDIVPLQDHEQREKA
jgi:hypothetical protein